MADDTSRKQRGPGRPFAPGESGNPAGRPKGSLNKVTRAAQMLLDGEAEAITRKAVDLALEGNIQALRLCLERLLPPKKALTPAEVFSLPEGDLLSQVQAVLRQVAGGELSPTTATEIVSMVAAAARVEEVDQLRNEVNSLKRVLEKRKGEQR